MAEQWQTGQLLPLPRSIVHGGHRHTAANLVPVVFSPSNLTLKTAQEGGSGFPRFTDAAIVVPRGPVFHYRFPSEEVLGSPGLTSPESLCLHGTVRR